MNLSIDRLAAMLDLTESRRRITEGLDDTPPKILFASYPAILVSIDGEPQLREVEGSTTLKYVVNTPFLMVLSPRGGFYLYAGRRELVRGEPGDGAGDVGHECSVRGRRIGSDRGRERGGAEGTGSR